MHMLWWEETGKIKRANAEAAGGVILISMCFDGSLPVVGLQ